MNSISMSTPYEIEQRLVVALETEMGISFDEAQKILAFWMWLGVKGYTDIVNKIYFHRVESLVVYGSEAMAVLDSLLEGDPSISVIRVNLWRTRNLMIKDSIPTHIYPVCAEPRLLFGLIPLLWTYKIYPKDVGIIVEEINTHLEFVCTKVFLGEKVEKIVVDAGHDWSLNASPSLEGLALNDAVPSEGTSSQTT